MTIQSGPQVSDAEKTLLPEELLTPAQVAAWLGVPRGWVDDRTRRGDIPYFKIGRYNRFRRADVERYLDACFLNAR